MKTTSNKWLRLLAASLLPLLFLGTLAAQDAPKVGFIRLVNVVSPGTGNLHLKIDGEEMYAKGYTMGQRTGGIGLLAGSKKVTVSKEARILRLKQRDVEKGYRLTVLSTCKQPEILFETDIQGRDKPEGAGVKRLMTTSVDLGGAGGDITVRLRGSQDVLTSFSPDDPGNYVLILYDGPENKPQAIYFYDPKFVIAG